MICERSTGVKIMLTGHVFKRSLASEMDHVVCLFVHYRRFVRFCLTYRHVPDTAVIPGFSIPTTSPPSVCLRS